MLTLQGEGAFSLADVTDKEPLTSFAHPMLNKTAREIEASFKD